MGRAAAGAGAADVAIAARPAAAQAALLVLLSRARARRRGGAGLQDIGEAITAGGSEAGIGRLVARLVCEGLGAQRAVVYTGSSPDDLEAVAGHGFRREELSSGPGRALARDALRRGEAMATGAPATGARALAAGGQPEEVLSLPLVHEERPVGVVQVFLGAARPDRPAMLDVLLDRAAEAIDRARAHRRRDEDGRRMAALVDIASKAGVAASAADTLAAVGAHIATLVPGTSAAVFVLREGRVALAEPVTALQSSYGAAVSTLLRGDGLTDAITVADAQRDPRLSGIAADLSTAGIRAIVVVPLRFRDEPIGAIALASQEPGRFADDTAAILRRAGAADRAGPRRRAAGGLGDAQRGRARGRRWARSGAHAASSTAQETVARVAAEAGRATGQSRPPPGRRWTCWTSTPPACWCRTRGAVWPRRPSRSPRRRCASPCAACWPTPRPAPAATSWRASPTAARCDCRRTRPLTAPRCSARCSARARRPASCRCC